MATPTYTPIESKTLGSAANNITFTSIPQTYTDLILVFNGDLTSITGCSIRVGNGSIDTGSNYSLTRIWGKVDGTYGSNRESNGDQIRWDYWAAGNGSPRNAIFHFQNYSNTTTYKTILTRTNIPSTETLATVGLWRSTSAINQISLMLAGGTTYTAGSTATLYGISNADSTNTTPKAFGGTITSDSTYYYHTFTGSNTFTPLQSLTADVLCIAGGGSGGTRFGGGGGAGGLVYLSSQSLTTQAYPILVGAGGAGRAASGGGSGNQGYNGNNSRFGTLTAAVGGGGGGAGDGSSGNSGGSGGGGAGRNATSGGSPTSGQGNAGGSSNGGRPYTGAGGGGAGAAGSNAQSSGNGGDGVNTYSSWASATSTGVTGYYAGGGGGGGAEDGATGPGSGGAGGGGRGSDYTTSNAVAGTANTGSGGGGGAYNGSADNASASGGSGIIIVRYLKA